ncbi:Subtilisin inhibitor 1 [Hordeum vulgare]|nr:Subtilisin inhibitor 1 [Hordeum vulgare]
MESGGVTAGVGAEKNSWPEVVGLSSEEAKKKIVENKPDASVHVVPADSFVTMDYNTGRVRVFVDSNDKITVTSGGEGGGGADDVIHHRIGESGINPESDMSVEFKVLGGGVGWWRLLNKVGDVVANEHHEEEGFPLMIVLISRV